MSEKAKIDAWQKFQNALLSQYNIEELAELKRSNWSGFLVGIDRLYATMYHEWDALQKDVNDIAGAVRTLEWTVVPHVKDGEEADEHAQHVANVVNEAIWKRARVPLGGYSHSFLQLVESMVHAVFRGYNAHQIEWANDGQLVYPARYVQLYPQFLQWETQSGKPDRLLLVPDGQSGQGVPFADDMFIVALNNNGPDHPLYNATFYSLVNWFLAYKFGLGWFMQFAQKYGMPKQVFRYGSEREKEALINEMEDDRVLNSIFLKGDRQYEIINPPQGGASMPQAVLVQKAEEACHKAILGQTLTSDTSAHGGSLAQAKVHAGVRAELVLQKAEFVCEILNQQLIPAIVRANFGRTEGVPMPELRCKLPQEQHTADVLNYWKTVKEMGIPFKKSEFHDSTGISMPGEGDDVYGGEQQQGAIPGMEGEANPQGNEDGDDDPEPPGGGGGSDAVTAAKREKMDAAQAWLEPLKARLREARARGASLEEIAKKAKEWRPDTVALAQSMAENVKRGLLGEGEDVSAEHCNQYQHAESCEKTSDYQGDNEWDAETAKKVWENRMQGKEANKLVNIKGIDVDVSVDAGVGARSAHSALRADYYKKAGTPYADARKEWESIVLPILKEKIKESKKTRFEDIENHIKSGKNNMPAIKQAIKEKVIPAAPERHRFKEAPQLTDEDMRKLFTARDNYFNKRNIEVLELLKKELGDIEKVDVSRKSASTYFYLKNGRKIRLSDHIDQYNWQNRDDVSYSDSDEEILRKLKGESVKAENPYGCNQHAHGWVGQCPYDDPPQGEEWKPPVRKKDKGEEEVIQPEKKKYFEPATTMKEAKKNTASLIGGDLKKVTWGQNVTLEQVNEYNEAIAEMMQKYPINARISKLGSYTKNLKKGVGAHCVYSYSKDRTNIEVAVQINQDGMKGGIHRLDSWLPYTEEEAKKSGYTRHNVGVTEEGMSMRVLLIHEWGHAVHAKIHILAHYGGIFKGEESEKKEAVENWREWEHDVYFKALKNGDVKKISEYAATNSREFFAECFTARELGEKLPEYIESPLDKITKYATRKA